jgi:hypothetical protein
MLLAQDEGVIIRIIVRSVWPKTTTVRGEVVINRTYGGFTVLLQDDEKGHVIIGEAALHLALAKKEISVLTLIAELRRMAVDVKSDGRRVQLTEARKWLQGFIVPGRAKQPMPYLQVLAGLNEETK